MHFSLTNLDSTYTTEDAKVFKAVFSYVTDTVFDSQYCDQIAQALMSLQLVEKASELRTSLLQQVKNVDPLEDLRSCLALKTLGVSSELPKSVPVVTPDVLDTMLLVGYDQPIAISALRGFANIQTPPALDEILVGIIRPNVVIAGGYPTINCCPGLKGTQHSDVDVWVFGEDEVQRKQVFNSLMERLFSRGKVVAGLKGSSVLTFSIPNYPRNIQLIMSSAHTADEVVRCFDMDAARSYYCLESSGFLGLQHLECYALPETIQAWRTRTISKVTVVDSMRLAKMQCRGFNVSVPYRAPSQEKLDEYMNSSYIHNPNESQERIRFMMKKLMGVDQVYFSMSEVLENFSYKAIYDLNLDYLNTGLKVIPDTQTFKFQAVVRFVSEGDCNRLATAQRQKRVALHLTAGKVPDELFKFDTELVAKYKNGILHDSLLIYCYLPPGVKYEDGKEYTVKLNYYGVANVHGAMGDSEITNGFYPILRARML
jgi:hypothetical protein